MAYCTADDVMKHLRGVDISALGNASEQEAAAADAAQAASLWVDGFTRRRFEAVTEAWSFDGSGTDTLFVPDLLVVEEWSMDGLSCDTAELLLCPRTQPHTWLRLKCGVFSRGIGNVVLKGTWGYGYSVPNEVVRCTAMLAAADLLGRTAAARDRGTSATVQGALSEHYENGAYSTAIQRLRRDAVSVLVRFRRPIWSF
ncbi:MAG: hypothetical protein ACP5R4_07285 [Armatimonadota bacterium]